ncbi:hypothetical protein [Paenibacillus protaetiae]|nr:hypothetical protein [Paenibacillus protaetiae]
MKDEENHSFIHMNVITLVDKQGKVRKYINGSEEQLTADDILAELKKLM